MFGVAGRYLGFLKPYLQLVNRAVELFTWASEVGNQEGPGFVLSRRGAKLRRLHGDEVEDTLLLGAGTKKGHSDKDDGSAE